ncbi:MAG: hypothetical protein DMG06_14330 [Acidobacteria bacterium]|nr:MAG: hypothetical protein DMG06_14330 [Acidobacteriota bacterium]
MKIDFETLCLVSVPAFLIGLMTGRLIASSRWQSIKKSLGILGRLLSAAAFIAYLGASVITLSVMIIYIANFPETAKPTNFWLTLLFALWIFLNLVHDLRSLLHKQRDTEPSSS